jgi:hypothetical protein
VSVRVQYPGIGEEDVEETHFLCSDHGSYIFLGAKQNQSAYCGVSFLDLSRFALHKALHDIRPRAEKTASLKVSPVGVERFSNGVQERFFMHDRLACYSAVGTAKVDLLFDIRDVYDNHEQGREHTASPLPLRDGISGLRVKGKDGAYAVLCDARLERADKWVEESTKYDSRRGGQASWWVWHGATLAVHGRARLVVAPFSRLDEAYKVFANESCWGLEEEWSGPLHLARNSLEGYKVYAPTGEPGLLAGLPWFFQIYTRDEAISAGALLALKEHDLAARILLREIRHVLDDGRVPNRFPESMVGSADGHGWAFTRLLQLLRLDAAVLSDEQWRFVYDQAALSADRLSFRDGMVLNHSQETWMDTTGGTSDDRAGCRVEVQALALSQLRLCSELSRSLDPDRAEEWLSRELALRERVREVLFHDPVLADGYNNGVVDLTVRPNVFLARYVYPDLLSADEWERALLTARERLWLDWGGLCTIPGDDALFCPQHTGSDDRSYHRGDSWYFLNNIAAIALLDTNERFASDAQRIADASLRDLLWAGAAGHSSEISSAKKPEALGCWSQAWSVATLIELLVRLDPSLVS